MELRLFNTLTRKKEVFQPIKVGRVGMYTCGPTVYAHAHIGNLRSYVFPHVLVRVLRLLGYQVQQVINITDVGHLTSDADTGEDKLERAARQAERSAWDIAEEFTALFLRDLEWLNIEVPELLPRATGHVPEQIAMIEKLEAGGYTYTTSDGVYFNTANFTDYGRLAKLQAEGLQEGSRVEMGEKRNKTDFALWKFSPPERQRQMEWDSPWGRGFPGWHIECSAMSIKYLGAPFDIHTGGTDHIPVHHTNEIAQSEAALGHPFVNVWLHGDFLVLGEEKRMGKSEGNMMTLQDLVDAGFEPLAFRYLALNSHYRHFLTFTMEALKAADKALMGLRRLVYDAGGAGHEGSAGRDGAAPEAKSEEQRALLADICDDLNAPKALGTLWIALRDQSLSAERKVALAAFADSLLCLDLFDFSRLEVTMKETVKIEDSIIVRLTGPGVPEKIKNLADTRWKARQAKDFAESDRLRDLIANKGYTVRDRENGYELRKT